MSVEIPVIYRLSDKPEWAALCAAWDDAAWPRSPAIEDFFSEHYTEASQSKPSDIPQVWVAAIDNEPVGMISLIQDDHPDFLELTPWLAAAYVIPERHGQGIFKMLHDALIRHVATVAKLSAIHVYTHMDFEKFGWEILQQTYDPFDPQKIVTIFKKSL